MNDANEKLGRLKRGLQAAKSTRMQWESHWQDCYDIMLPAREGFYSRTEGQRRQTTIYDETAMVGVPELVGRLQSELAPDGLAWATFESPDATEEEKVVLEEEGKLLFDLLGRSNFGMEFPEALTDLVVSTCCIRIDRGQPHEPIKCEAIPQSKFWIEAADQGDTAGIYVERSIPWALLERRYPHAPIGRDLRQRIDKAKPGERACIWEVALRDFDYAGEAWSWCVWIDGVQPNDNGALLRDVKRTGEGSCPFVIGRWTKAAGETYGRGPALMALPAARTVNKVIEDIFKHTKLALAGIWQAEDDGVFNPHTAQIVPGSVLTIGVGSKGLQNVMPDMKLQLAQIVLDEQRHNIRKALYSETLGPREGTPPTALEIQERLNELARQLGPAFQRVWHELMVGILRRVRWLLIDQGRFNMPRIDQRKLKAQPRSILAKAQQAQETRGAQMWMGMVANTMGPQVLQTLVNLDKFAAWSADRYAVPKAILYTAAERKRLAQAAGKALGQAAQDPNAAAMLPAAMGAMGMK